MAWSARLEIYSGAGREGPHTLVSAQTVSGVGAAGVSVGPFGPWPASGGQELPGWGRLVGLAGALVFATGAAPTPGDTTGARIEAGREAWIALADGDVVAMVEAASGPVGVAPGENHLGEVGGSSAVAGASFTRPANTLAYATGQIIANSVTAGSVAPLALPAARKAGGTGLVRRARLSSSNPAAVGASLRLHLFKSAPTLSRGDAGVFAGAVNGVASVNLGAFDVTLDRAFSDGAKGVGTPSAGTEIVFDTAAGSTSLYGLLEARSAYTPASAETFTVALEVLRD